MLRFRSRKEAEEAGVLRQRDKADHAAPLSRGVNEVEPVRESGRRAKAERRAADTAGGAVPRGKKRNRFEDKLEQPGLGTPVGDAGGTFSLDLAPSEVQCVEPGLALGESPGASARRTLLDGMALPMPPSINAYWSERVVWSAEKQRHFAIRYVTHEGKAYQKYIRELMLERRAWYRSPHPVALYILCCFADERDQDIDNRVKVLQDAIKNGFVIVDDKQVKRLEVREGPRMKPATVFVRLHEILPDRNENLSWIRTSN